MLVHNLRILSLLLIWNGEFPGLYLRLGRNFFIERSRPSKKKENLIQVVAMELHQVDPRRKDAVEAVPKIRREEVASLSWHLKVAVVHSAKNQVLVENSAPKTLGKCRKDKGLGVTHFHTQMLEQVWELDLMHQLRTLFAAIEERYRHAGPCLRYSCNQEVSEVLP